MKQKLFLVIVLLSAVLKGELKAQTMKDGLSALDMEKYEAARSIFKTLVAQSPTDGDLYYYLGQSYLYLINLDSAEITYKQGIQLVPANPSNYAGMGELCMYREKPAEAKTYFDKALSFSKARNGNYTDIHAIHLVAESMVPNQGSQMLDEAEALIKMGYEQNKKDYDLLISGGDVYLEKNDGGNAATFYERAIAVDPNNAKAYSKVADIWLRVKNYEAAQNDLNRAFKINPNYAPAWKSQAELYYAKRNFAKAKEAFTTYLANSEPSIANQVRFARILFLSKDYETALERIDEIQKTDKTNLLLYRLKGYSTYELISTKNDETKAKAGYAALDYYMKTVDPKNLVALDYAYLGRLQSKINGMDSLALMNLQKALEMDSRQVEIYQDYARIYNKMKRFNEAGDMYEKYLGVAKKPTPADYYLMGKAYYYGKRFGKADTAFMKVNELKPDYPDAYLWRGNCNSSLDPEFTNDIAKTNYEKYLELITADTAKFNSNLEKYKKDLINVYSYMGYYHLNKENKNLSKEFYRKVLDLDPENENAKKVLQGLK